MNDILYKKVGRKYVPQSRTFDYETAQPVGTFMLTYAYTDGGKAYNYAVTPDTASFVAAAMVAQKALEQAIRDKSEYRPDTRGTALTKKQAAILLEYRQKMREAGGNMPNWWSSSSSYELSQSAIDAVRDFKP